MPRQERKPRRGARSRSAFVAWDGDAPTIDKARAEMCTDPQGRAEYIAELISGNRFIHHRTKRELLVVWSDIKVDRLNQLCTHGAVLARSQLGKSPMLEAIALNTIEAVRAQCLHIGDVEHRAGGEFAFKWFELALQASQSLLAFRDAQFDRWLAKHKERRDVERHTRDMKDSPQPGAGPAVQVIINRGPVDEDGAPLPDESCSKSN